MNLRKSARRSDSRVKRPTKVLHYIKPLRSCKINDSLRVRDSFEGPFEGLDSLQELVDDYYLTPEQVLQEFQAYATTDQLDEFISHCEDAFDLPESLSDSFMDFISDMCLSYEQVLTELDAWLDTDQINEFTLACIKSYDLDAITDSVSSAFQEVSKYFPEADSDEEQYYFRDCTADILNAYDNESPGTTLKRTAPNEFDIVDNTGMILNHFKLKGSYSSEYGFDVTPIFTDQEAASQVLYGDFIEGLPF